MTDPSPKEALRRGKGPHSPSGPHTADMSWMSGPAGGLVGGAYGAARGKFGIRRTLDTWRTSGLLLVLLASVLIAAFSLWGLLACLPLIQGQNRDDAVGGLVVAAIFGLLLVSALRLIADTGLRWWWRGPSPPRAAERVTPPSHLRGCSRGRSEVGVITTSSLQPSVQPSVRQVTRSSSAARRPARTPPGRPPGRAR